MGIVSNLVSLVLRTTRVSLIFLERFWLLLVTVSSLIAAHVFVRWWSSLSRLAGPCRSRWGSSKEVWFRLSGLRGSRWWQPPACRQRWTGGRQGRPPRVVHRRGGRGDGHFWLLWSFHAYEGVFSFIYTFTNNANNIQCINNIYLVLLPYLQWQFSLYT